MNIVINLKKSAFAFPQQYSTTILYDPTRKKESSPAFKSERETCLTYFMQWNEADQVDFVEQLLSTMCNYQHGHINAFLKPMLQRDFISLLPSKCFFYVLIYFISIIFFIIFTSQKRDWTTLPNAFSPTWTPNPSNPPSQSAKNGCASFRRECCGRN